MFIDIPPQAIEIVKHFEGCELKAYQDIGGKWTIGVGHTGKEVRPETIITTQKAHILLIEDIQQAAQDVLLLTDVQLGDAQFSALLDFIYNVGSGAYAKSTLRYAINKQNKPLIMKEFTKWANVHGKISKDLQRRREAELRLFLSDIK